MAEVATVVGSALGKLAEVLAGALLDKIEKLQGVSEQIELEQRDLRLIQALLSDAGSKRNRYQLVAEWLEQVKLVAQRIETAINTFEDQIKENRAESSNLVRKIMKAVKRNYNKYKFGLPKELEDIIGELKRIWQHGTDLGIRKKLDALDDVDDPDPSDNVPDPDVVGFENVKGKIIEQLLDSSSSRRTVLSIVGTGGLGKTALAQKVYKSEELKGQFGCHAWLTVSEKYNLNDLFREILYSVEPRMKKKNPPDGDLVPELKSSLRSKRYLIILDDVWDIDLWEQFEIALPVDSNESSCVIITTRSLDVAKVADCNTEMFKLDYLNDDDSLALLFRRAFQQHIQPENYPRDLMEIAQRLTKKYGGLPLALVVLGGILRRRDHIYSAWSKVEETMDWHDKDGDKCMKILAKSYEDLPDHLKSCFLCLAVFPEDHEILGWQVIRMWTAEEFIPNAGGGTIEGRTEKCLEELVQRCLIQVTKKSWNGYCKCFRKHSFFTLFWLSIS